MPLVRELMRQYFVFKNPKTGTINVSNAAPTGNVKAVRLYVLENGTTGRVVFTEDALAELERRESAGQESWAKDMDRRKAEATRRCEQEFGPRQAELDRKWREMHEAENRLLDARLETIRARDALSSTFEQLNQLREFQDTMQDIAGVAIDVGAVVATGGGSVLVTTAWVLAGAANTALRSGGTGVGDQPEFGGLRAVGENFDSRGEALVDLLADGTGAYIEAAGETTKDAVLRGAGRYVIGGAQALADIGEFFKRPDLYRSTLTNVQAVRAIRDHFLSKDPRSWMERWRGPDLDEIRRRFDRTINAMENEQKAAEDAAKKRKAYESDKTPNEIGVCIDRLVGVG